MRYVAIIVGMSCALSASNYALGRESNRKSPQSASIETLRAENLESLPYMCECEFFRGPINGATTVFATRRERTVALAMLDGRLVTLHRDGKPAKSICRKNVSYHERWVGGPWAVVLDQRATGPGEEACWYGGKMTVTAGNRTASTSVSGACGC